MSVCAHTHACMHVLIQNWIVVTFPEIQQNGTTVVFSWSKDKKQRKPWNSELTQLKPILSLLRAGAREKGVFPTYSSVPVGKTTPLLGPPDKKFCNPINLFADTII